MLIIYRYKKELYILKSCETRRITSKNGWKLLHGKHFENASETRVARACGGRFLKVWCSELLSSRLRLLLAVCFYWHIRNGVRTYAFSRKSLLLDYRNIMLVRSWQNLRVARLRRIFTCRYRVVFVFFGVSDLSVCTAAWVGLKCIGGCFVGYYVRNIHASAICRFVAGCCNRAAAHCCQVLLGNVIFDSK